MKKEELRFYDMRAKDGRDVVFADAELLWSTAREYFNYCMDNPIKAINPQGGKSLPAKVQALTLQGLCVYLGCSPRWYNEFKEGLMNREDKLTDKEQEIQETIVRIEQVIYMYKYNYAVAGLLNASMVTRDLELNEKKEREGKRIIRVRVEGEPE